MPPDFEIQANWIPGEFERDDIAATMAEIGIKLNGTVMEIEDIGSRSVRPTVRLSALPLALWFASSWWRLRWEGMPSGARRPTSWRMAHEMPAAGHGFIWPAVSFGSDGNSIEVRCVPTVCSDSEPIRYLSALQASIGATEFEKVVDGFVHLVIERLRVFGRNSSGLAELWAEVRTERADTDLSEYRKIEALLGFDPDEAPGELIGSLISMFSTAGRGAIAEIAALGGRREAAGTVQKLKDISTTDGVQARMAEEIERVRAEYTLNAPGPPWRLGWDAAKRLRAAASLGDSRLDDGDLDQFFGTSIFPEHDSSPDRPPIGFAVRRAGPSEVNLHFRKPHREGRRFEAARFIAEGIFAPAEDRWLPVSDSKTYRQKVQRSFAAEFLAPLSSLQSFLNGDFSPDATDEAAAHFGLSRVAIRSHLANHGIIRPDEVSV